jgi:hypothetical protein
MYKYFENCASLEEAKSLYKKLARENHPDFGGDTRTMQDINADTLTSRHTRPTAPNAPVKRKHTPKGRKPQPITTIWTR